MLVTNKQILKLFTYFIKTIGGFYIKFEENKNKRSEKICKLCDLDNINLSVDEIIRITRKNYNEQEITEDEKVVIKEGEVAEEKKIAVENEKLLRGEDLYEYIFSVSATNLVIRKSNKYCIKCLSGIGEDITSLLDSSVIEITVNDYKIFIFHNDGNIRIQELKKYYSMHAAILYENDYLLGRVDIGKFSKLKVNEKLRRRNLKIPVEIINDRTKSNSPITSADFRFLSFKCVADNDSSFVSLTTTRDMNYLELGLDKDRVKFLKELPQSLKYKIDSKYNKIKIERIDQLSHISTKNDTESRVDEKIPKNKDEFHVIQSLNKQDQMASMLFYALMAFALINFLIIRYKLFRKFKKFILNTIMRINMNCIADKEMEL